MSLYNVVKPCVVGNLHYVRPTVIDVDESVAAQVEDGCLEPVRAQAELNWPTDAEVQESSAADAEITQVLEQVPISTAKPRRGRRSGD